MKKRILSLLLAFSMAATLAPATALVGGSTAKAAVTSFALSGAADTGTTNNPVKTWIDTDKVLYMNMTAQTPSAEVGAGFVYDNTNPSLAAVPEAGDNSVNAVISRNADNTGSPYAGKVTVTAKNGLLSAYSESVKTVTVTANDDSLGSEEDTFNVRLVGTMSEISIGNYKTGDGITHDLIWTPLGGAIKVVPGEVYTVWAMDKWDPAVTNKLSAAETSSIGLTIETLPQIKYFGSAITPIKITVPETATAGQNYTVRVSDAGSDGEPIYTQDITLACETRKSAIDYSTTVVNAGFTNENAETALLTGVNALDVGDTVDVKVTFSHAASLNGKRDAGTKDATPVVELASGAASGVATVTAKTASDAAVLDGQDKPAYSFVYTVTATKGGTTAYNFTYKGKTVSLNIAVNGVLSVTSGTSLSGNTVTIPKGGSGFVEITNSLAGGRVWLRNNGGIQVTQPSVNTGTVRFPISVDPNASGTGTTITFGNGGSPEELISVKVNYSALTDILTLLNDDDFAINADVTDNGTIDGTAAFGPANLNDDNATVVISGNTAQFELLHTVFENVPGITTKYDWQSSGLKNIVGVEIVPGTRTVGKQRVDVIKLTNLDKANLVEGYSYKLTITSWNGNTKISNDLVINLQTINKDSEVTFNAGVGGTVNLAGLAGLQNMYRTGVWTLVDNTNIKQALKNSTGDTTFPYYAMIAAASAAFSRPGYIITGWYDETNKISYDEDGAILTGSSAGGQANLHPATGTGAKLIAQWDEAPINVAFHANKKQIHDDFDASVSAGSDGYSQVSYEHENMRINNNIDKFSSSGIANNISEPGYEIIGWTTVFGGNRVEYKDGAPINAALFRKARNLDSDVADGNEVILYAVWQPITYEIKFEANRRGYTAEPFDKAVESIKKVYSEDITIGQWPSNSFRTAQRGFLGWNTAADGSGVWVIDNSSNAASNQTFTNFVNARAGIFATDRVVDNNELGNDGNCDRDGDGVLDGVTKELTLYAIWRDGYNVVCYSNPYSSTGSNEIFTTFSVPFPVGTDRTSNANSQLLPVGNIVRGWRITRWQTSIGIQTEKYTVNDGGSIIYTGLQDEVNLYPDTTARVAIDYTASFSIGAGLSSNDSNNRPFYINDANPIKLPTVTSAIPNAYTFMGWVYRTPATNTTSNYASFVINGIYKGVDVPATATSISLEDGMKNVFANNEVQLVAIALPNAMMADLDTAVHGFAYENGMEVSTGVPYRFDVAYGTSLESIKANLNTALVLIHEAGVVDGDVYADINAVWDSAGIAEKNQLGKQGVKLIKSVTWTGDYNASKPGTYTLTGTVTPNDKVVGNAATKQTITVKITVAAPVVTDKVTAVDLGEYVITVPAGTNYAEIFNLIEEQGDITVTTDTGRSYTRTAVSDANGSLLGTTTNSGYWSLINIAAFRAQGAGATNKPASGAYVFYSLDAGRDYIDTTYPFTYDGTATGELEEDDDIIHYPVGSVAKLVVVVGDAEFEGVAKVTSISPIAGITVERGTLLSAIKAMVDSSAVINLSDGTTTRGAITWDWSELADYTVESPDGYSKTITGIVSNTSVVWGNVEPKVTVTITVGGKPEKVATTAAEIQKLLADNYLLRFFNIKTGEHFYTTDFEEYVSLVTLPNWIHETYVSGSNTFKGSRTLSSVYNTPVYRLFNIVNGGHLYTKDLNEVAKQVASRKWVRDESTFYVSMDEKNSVPYYRQVRVILMNGKAMLQHNYAPKAEFDYNNANGWTADFNGDPIWYSPAN